MLKMILVLVVLIVLGGGGFFLYQNLQTKPASQPTTQPRVDTSQKPPQEPKTSEEVDACQILEKGSADLPPLYKEDITWQQPKIAEYEVPLSEGKTQFAKGCLLVSTKITENVAENVRSYYFDGLKKLEWNNQVSADSPYSGRESYQKGDKLIYVRKYVVPGTQPQTQNPPIIVEIFYSQ